MSWGGARWTAAPARSLGRGVSHVTQMAVANYEAPGLDWSTPAGISETARG
ncbi:hypothetical protein IF2G_08322 [Cordyceps javanica]|nr:hypothetical protein IF2G_08322 [Cordyceps javanica]